MNCFLQPMYSFRIGGGALKDYSYKFLKVSSLQIDSEYTLNEYILPMYSLRIGGGA